MALAYLASDLHNQGQLGPLAILHVNHRLRGEEAIADARQNAAHNGIESARFVAQDAAAFMQGYAALGKSVDAVFMDPPRAGASAEFLEALVGLAPSRIIYISCNPETQVRDICTQLAGGYTLEVVQPVDMFPHTTHIETVALLSYQSK